LKFPLPRGRAVDPINGFPLLGSVRQTRLGFIYASWLWRTIANQLNEVGNHVLDFDWQAYHIEMVAFQLGHKV